MYGQVWQCWPDSLVTQGDQELKASLGYKASLGSLIRPCLKLKVKGGELEMAQRVRAFAGLPGTHV